MNTLFEYAPLIGLTFFFAIFVGIFVSVVRPGAKQKLQILALIPLKEDDHDRSQ